MDAEQDSLAHSHTIAVVGLSPAPDRPSHYVSKYLQEHGYRIIPVNPMISEVLGEKSYPDLKSIPEPVDMVDIFRRPELVMPVVEEAIEIGARVRMDAGRHRQPAGQGRSRGCRHPGSHGPMSDG